MSNYADDIREMHVKFSRGQHDDLMAVANRWNLTASEVIRSAVEQFLEAADGASRPQALRTPTLFIGNNPLQLAQIVLVAQVKLDTGRIRFVADIRRDHLHHQRHLHAGGQGDRLVG